METKAWRRTKGHIARMIESARWLARRRRRYPTGVAPMLCVTRVRHLGLIDGAVPDVSLGRLVSSRRSAAAVERPGPGILALSARSSE